MRIVAVLLLLIPLALTPLVAAQQQPSTSSGVDAKALLDRIDQLEKRVQELESRLNEKQTQANTAATATPAASVPVPQPPDTVSVASDSQGGAAKVKEAVESDRGLKIRGFGQATFIGDDLHGDRPLFNTGNLTLLLTSRLSDKVSALGEIAFDEEGYGSPTFETVLERAVLQYEHNDYLKVSAGRFFSSIGYYNTTFYNADWAQTTMRRPMIASFQDDGGLAPMQRNGVSVSGRIPSGGLGLHYVAEIGGGDNNRSDVLGLGYEFPIQARTGYNFALFARPGAISGLQVGGSVFHDTEIPYIDGAGDPLVRQTIVTAYAAYQNPKWEFLNEFYLVHHAVHSYRNYNVPAFYTQVSHRLTPSWRPYFRFTYVNGGQDDPMLPDMVGRQTGIETGARYNFSEWIGLKFEYDRMHIESQHKDINLGGTQLVFTF